MLSWLDLRPRLLAALVVGTLPIVPATGGAATPTARYEVRFDATWSAASHPISFPANAHWSSLIGGTHDASVHFWNAGELATQGIQDMAERGLTSPLDLEVEAAITTGHAGEVIRGGGIAVSPGTVATTFEVTQSFPLVTLVTMIAPSPDWFVGVSSLSLLQGDEWIGLVHVPLFAWDAGTDSGTSYTSPNQPTNPHVPIAPNGAAPFANGTPLGIFTFTRVDAPITTQVPAASPLGLLALAIALLLVGGWLAARRWRSSLR